MALARTACKGNAARETRTTPMYIPTAFAEPDLSKLHDFIDQHSFGLLVSQVDGLPFASHLPLLLERTAGPHGTLVGHMARANPQWREAVGKTVLAIFSGPHAYISPTWYEAEQVVPTWNYTAVHAYGKVETIEDEGALLDIVQKTVRVYEQAMPRASFAAFGAEVALALHGGFRAHLFSSPGKVLRHRNLHTHFIGLRFACSSSTPAGLVISKE
jgi:hypothetical protein